MAIPIARTAWVQKRVLVPVRGNRPASSNSHQYQRFPIISTSATERQLECFIFYFFPSSDSLRLWTSKGVWGKYSSPERWPLTAGGGKTAPNPFNKHRCQSRSSALIVSLLMRASCSAAFPRLPSQLTLTHAWLRHYTSLLHDGFKHYATTRTLTQYNNILSISSISNSTCKTGYCVSIGVLFTGCN